MDHGREARLEHGVLTPDGVPYHEVWGAGEPLLLLHGGFCSVETMRPVGRLLAERAEVHALERPGHGRTPDVPGPYSFEAWVDQAVAYLDRAGLGSVHVVGFSDGAVIGLLLARDHPDRVRSLVAASANLSPEDAWVDDDYPHETVTAEAGAALEREYERLSPDGPAHAKVVMRKLWDLWEVQPQIAPESLRTITAPTLVLAGEHDTVAHDHTALVAASVPRARLAVVAGTTHMLMLERPDDVAREVLRTAFPA